MTVEDITPIFDNLDNILILLEDIINKFNHLVEINFLLLTFLISLAILFVIYSVLKKFFL